MIFVVVVMIVVVWMGGVGEGEGMASGRRERVGNWREEEGLGAKWFEFE